MLKKILSGIAVLILGFVIYVALQPSTYQVSRQTNISAPPDAVFALVNDFHKWDVWSPWAKLDPAMKTTYEGAPAGPGAIYSWAGNDKVGEGRMTILDSRPNESVRIKLEFITPFPSTSITELSMKGDAASTAVNWTMSGENNFGAKAALLMMGGMDKTVGPDFEKGLAQLKAAAEAHR
jgi:hypothetical protein